MKGKMMSIKTFFMNLSNDPKLGQLEGDDRVRHKVRTDDGRSMMRDTDDDGGHDDRVRGDDEGTGGRGEVRAMMDEM